MDFGLAKERGGGCYLRYTFLFLLAMCFSFFIILCKYYCTNFAQDEAIYYGRATVFDAQNMYPCVVTVDDSPGTCSSFGIHLWSFGLKMG